MKKFFNVVVRGYFVCSLVLGVLMHLLVLLVPHNLNSWYSMRHRFWEYDEMAIWAYLPTSGLYDALYGGNVQCDSIVIAALAIIVVTLFVMMTDGEGLSSAWRTKFLQAIGFAGVLTCWNLTFKYAITSMWTWTGIHPLMIFVPVIVMIIPLMVLIKTRQADQLVQGTKNLRNKIVRNKIVRKGFFTWACRKPLE